MRDRERERCERETLGGGAKMGAEAEMLPFLAQPKEENNGFKNKEQPELPEKYLHRSPTTKELKKHSTRGRRGRDQQQGRGRGEEAA